MRTRWARGASSGAGVSTCRWRRWATTSCEEGRNALNVEAEELDLSEFAEVAARDLELGEFVVSVDPATGGLERLWSLRQQREWCDAAHEVGRLQYDVYNSTDYERFFHEYFIVWNE